MSRVSLPGNLFRSIVAVAAVATLSGMGGFASETASAAVSAPTSSIAWLHASSDADVEKAFALGKQTGKPIFLYWGAIWCPPCNQVKATLFSRADFVERSRAFIPVYVDGDKPGAQKVASRFKVSGYPTMILFKSDGKEITRLPGEVDPQRYLMTLSAGMNAQVPVKDLVDQALAKKTLSAEQWRLLAYYSWDTDEQQVIPTAYLARRLDQLSAVAPGELTEVRDRLALKALAARAQDKEARFGSAPAASKKWFEHLISNAEFVKPVSDVLVYYAEPMLNYLAAPGPTRRDLAQQIDGAFAMIAAVERPSRVDQLDLLDSRISIWKAMDENGTLSANRSSAVLKQVAQIVASTADRYERQAVIPGAAHVLAEAGFSRESDELLKQELPKAVAPYYHMLVLAGNAKKRGDVKDALYWYEQAWRKSEGPATRLQWGTGWVNQVVELAPRDTSRVEAAAFAVIAQLEANSDVFFERNERSLKKMAAKLVKWQGTDATRSVVVSKVKTQLMKTCARLPVQDVGRSNCEGVFSINATS